MYTTPKDYKDTREHFIQRLKERYNIDLTEDEYDNLKSNKFIYQKLYNINSSTFLIWAKIKEQLVLCVYKKKENRSYLGGKYSGVKMPSRLATCLMFEQKLPCPVSLRKYGHTKETFEKAVNDAIADIMSAEFELQRVGSREFFMNKKINRHIKHMAYCWHIVARIDLNQVVKYIKYKISEDRILNLMNS